MSARLFRLIFAAVLVVTGLAVVVDATRGGGATAPAVVAIEQVGDPGAADVSGPVSIASLTYANGDVAPKAAQLPSALGQAAMANSLTVAIASNQSAVSVLPSSTTAGDGTVFAKNSTFPVSLGPSTAANAFLVTVATGSNWSHFHTSGVGTSGTLVDATARRARKLGFTSATTAAWAMIFDKASAPVNGDAPVWEIGMPSNANASAEVDFGLDGFTLVNGLGVAFSTSMNTLTLVGSNSMTINAEWSP